MGLPHVARPIVCRIEPTPYFLYFFGMIFTAFQTECSPKMSYTVLNILSSPPTSFSTTFLDKAPHSKTELDPSGQQNTNK